MNFKLTEMQEAVRSSARTYAQKYVLPRAEEIEQAESYPEDLFRTMAEMGLLGIPYPEAHGGLEAGYLSAALALEEIGRVSASAATLLCVCYLALDALHLYGNEKQLEQIGRAHV